MVNKPTPTPIPIPEPSPSGNDWLGQAKVLSEALPYMRRHAGETFVIKYGGHAMGDAELSKLFARDIVLLRQIGINPIVVHGGGPQIGQMLKRLRIKSEFVDGLRITDEKAVNVVEMVLSGSINKQIVTAINAAGGFAIGLSGKDGHLIKADKLKRTLRDPNSNIEQVLDLGAEVAAEDLHEGDELLVADGALARCGGSPRLFKPIRNKDLRQHLA